MAYIVVPNEIKNQIIYDYKKGDSVLALTKKYGYKYDKIYSLIQKENIPIRGNVSQRHFALRKISTLYENE